MLGLPSAERVRSRPFFRHPAQVVVFGFAAAVFIGTVLLMLPASRAGEGSARMSRRTGHTFRRAPYRPVSSPT